MDGELKIDYNKWKVLLASSGKTQQSICHLLNITKAAFSSRLKNKGKFSENEIKIISEALNVDPLIFLINKTPATTNYESDGDYRIRYEECHKRLQLAEELINQLKRDQSRSDLEIATLKDMSQKERDVAPNCLQEPQPP
ncbi:MAG: hypothetical protein WCK09_22210 [Bacteroidota bacterium]